MILHICLSSSLGQIEGRERGMEGRRVGKRDGGRKRDQDRKTHRSKNTIFSSILQSTHTHTHTQTHTHTLYLNEASLRPLLVYDLTGFGDGKNDALHGWSQDHLNITQHTSHITQVPYLIESSIIICYITSYVTLYYM